MPVLLSFFLLIFHYVTTARHQARLSGKIRAKAAFFILVQECSTGISLLIIFFAATIALFTRQTIS
jgi:uncharacterized membrane protein